MSDEQQTQPLVPSERKLPALNPNRDPFNPTTFDEAVALSKIIVESGLAPKGMDKPQTIFVVMMMGREVGLSTMQAVQNISNINGRPSVWGDAALGLVQVHPAYEWHKEFYEGEGEKRTAVFQIKRKGHDLHETRFSMGNARTAGLLNKDTYKSYPDRMIQMRARGFGLRDKFADALRGLSIAEEVMDAPPVVVSQAGQNTLPAHDSQGELKAKVEALLKEKQPQHNAAQRIVIMKRFDGHLQDLIDSLNGNTPAQSTSTDRASSEKEDRALESKLEAQSSPSASSVRETEKAAASGDAPNAHGVTITDHDLEGIGDQQEVKKGTAVESKRTQNATRKPSSGSFGF